MVVGVGSGVDVKRRSERGVAGKFEAVVGAVENFACVSWGGLGGEAFEWLFEVLARTSDNCFGGAGHDFLTRIRRVARTRASMFTDCFLSVAGLCARCESIFALSGTVAGFLA